MALLETPICDFGKKAVDFTLPGVDGQYGHFNNVWAKRVC